MCSTSCNRHYIQTIYTKAHYMWYIVIDICGTCFMLQNLQFNMLHQNLVCSFSRDNIEFSMYKFDRYRCRVSCLRSTICTTLQSHLDLFMCISLTYIEYTKFSNSKRSFMAGISADISILTKYSYTDTIYILEPHPKDLQLQLANVYFS